jgi:pyruvate formate lyase activating enzyme
MEFGGLEKFTLIDYPGKVACMVYTVGCNFRCPYCHNPELVNETVENLIPDGDVLDFLSQRKGILDGIVITGGEPTMHGQNLLDFISKVKNLGFKVKLDSNGTNPEFLTRVIDDNLIDYIAMDIKSPLSKYSQTVARAVNIDSIKKSIEILIKSNIDYEFRTTVVKSLINISDFEEIGNEIKGAKKYFIQKFIPTKILNPQFIKKVSYSDEELLEIQKIMSKYVKYCAIR